MFKPDRKVIFRRFISFRLFRVFYICLVISSLVLILPFLVVGILARLRIVPASKVPGARVAIVFGAGLWRDGSPTPVLHDRVTVAAELYFSGKVQKLLMSGSNNFIDYDEPGAMREYALGLGIPEQDIILDNAGQRTYDTCYRARVIFGVEQAILVTQSFHLPRALFLCNSLGVSAVGVQADLSEYRRSSLAYWYLREIPATIVAIWEVYLSHPIPVLGNPEPIFPPGTQ